MRTKIIVFALLSCLVLTLPAQVDRKDVRKIERLQKRLERIKGKLSALGVKPEAVTSTEYIEKVVIDSTYTEEAQLLASLLFECDSAGNVMIRRIDSLTSHNVDVVATFTDNHLVVSGTVPAKVIRIPKLMTSLNKTIVQQKITNVLTGWQTFMIWSGYIFWIAVFAAIAIYLILMRFRR